MKNLKIVIIGDSPATYVCAIYLFTANIKPIVLRNKMNFKYDCNILPGFEYSKEEYNQKCYEQAYNMGIEIKDAKNINVIEDNNKYKIEYDDQIIQADIIVSDTSLNIPKSDKIFIVEDKIFVKEAIVIAGEGCAFAFEIKEMANA